MARRQEPIALIKAKGKSHMSKAEMAEREAREIKVEPAKIKPPEYLPKELRKEFNKWAKALTDIGILTILDVDTLATYCMEKDEYLKLRQELADGLYPDIDDWSKAKRVCDTHLKEATAMARELGLTVSSRARLIVPESTQEVKKNKFDEFVE